MIIFDLDGTLADIRHRVHFVTPSETRAKKDWDSFHAACVNDKPNHAILNVMRSLFDSGQRIEIWTGRSTEYAVQTVEWLRLQNASWHALSMRPPGDRREDTVLKEEWLVNAMNSSLRIPTLVFEDRTRLVEMYRRRGITCCQVAEGNF